MSNISSEQIEKELKAATGDELRRNREVRSNYWRDLSLTAKLGPFPIESFFFIVILMFYPTYTSLFYGDCVFYCLRHSKFTWIIFQTIVLLHPKYVARSQNV